MDNLNTYGLASYWNKYRELGIKKMQDALLNKFQFFRDASFVENLWNVDTMFLNKSYEL